MDCVPKVQALQFFEFAEAFVEVIQSPITNK